MRSARGKIVSVEGSDSHEDLRWVRLDGWEFPFALWSSVFDGQLEAGQEVTLGYEPVDGRKFAKVLKVVLPGQGQRLVNKKKGFSKTEIGLMASVALKVAGQIEAAKLSANPKGKLSVEELFKLADMLYDWLAQKRVVELEDVEVEEGPRREAPVCISSPLK